MRLAGTRSGVLLIAIVLPLAVAPARAESDTTCADAGGAREALTTALSAESEKILGLLVKDGANGGRVAALKAYLKQPEPDPVRPADFVLRNYARLLLGAEYIRDGQYGKGRSLLTKVRLDSPAGVESALLTAHSHQQQGHTDAALDWYLRVSARYRASPRVLAALLDRADEAAATGDRQLATRLYERVVSKSLANLRDLARLTDRSEDISAVILDRQSARDSSATVAGQLIRELLRGSTPGALPHLEHVLQARKELRCLNRELEAVEDQLFKASERNTQADNFSTMLKREKGMLARRIGQLERQLKTARAHRRSALEQELAAKRRKLASLEDKMSELQKESGAARTLEQRKQQLARKQRELRQYRQEHRQAVRREMEQLVVRLKKRYLNLAGEGQVGRASLMRSVALHHTR